MIEPRRGRLVHAVPGRVRVRLEPGELTDDFGSVLIGALAGLPGVEDVRLTPRTGSVVITYDPEALDVGRLTAHVRGANLLQLESGGAAGADRPPSQTAVGLMRAFGEVDARLAELTGGRWDLRTVVPFVFGSLAVRAALRDFGSIAAAPWYVFAWYAFDSFWKLNERDRQAGGPRAEAPTLIPPSEERTD